MPNKLVPPQPPLAGPHGANMGANLDLIKRFECLASEQSLSRSESTVASWAALPEAPFQVTFVIFSPGAVTYCRYLEHVLLCSVAPGSLRSKMLSSSTTPVIACFIFAD